MTLESEAASLTRVVKYTTNQIHTTTIGHVIAYDHTLQKATIQPIIMHVRLDPDTDERTAYLPPPISNVPVYFSAGGGSSDTFPLIPGDEVILLFAERSLDEWKTSGASQNIPRMGRRHHLTDAIALPGIRSFANPLVEIDATARVVAASELRLGSKNATDYVALATLVRAELNALWSAVQTHVHVTTATIGAGATPGVISPSGGTTTAGSVGAQKVKAE